MTFLLFLSFPLTGTVLDSNFTQSPFVTVSGGQITSIAWAPDGSNRLFVTLKEGQVRIVKDGVVMPTAFATEAVFTSSECGLLGIAFDPGFVSNGYVYLFATVSSSGSMPRTIRPRKQAVATTAPIRITAVPAAAQVPGAECVLDVETADFSRLAGDAARLATLSDSTYAGSFLLQRTGQVQRMNVCAAPASLRRFMESLAHPPREAFRLLPAEAVATGNSAYPRPSYDGTLWNGRGVNAAFTAGAPVTESVLQQLFLRAASAPPPSSGSTLPCRRANAVGRCDAA